MSRFNNEADRKAYLAHGAKVEHDRQIAKWLKHNPQIGVLNGGNYYIIKDGKELRIRPLQVAK